MHESILIPTDFTITSLNLLKQALKNNEDREKSYILVFVTTASDSITDLLFSSKSSFIKANTNDTFLEGLDILKNKYSETIKSIQIEPFYGFTKAAFRNFINANDVSEVYLPTEKLVQNHTDFQSIYNYTQKLNLNQVIVEWDQEYEEYSSNAILQLFNS